MDDEGQSSLISALTQRSQRLESGRRPPFSRSLRLCFLPRWGCMLALQAEVKAESEKLLQTPRAQELMAKLKAQYGDDKAGFMKAWMKEWMEMAGSITQKYTQKYTSGVMFYASLGPVNDSHYAGQGVKLGAPDRAIFWCRPTGAAEYRVLYADLSIKEMTPEVVKTLPELKTE